MNVNHGIESLKNLPDGAIVSIGNFDGVHVGHARIIQTMKSLRGDDERIAIVTFEPHPIAALRPERAPLRITPFEKKRELLDVAGVDELIVLKPDQEVLDLTAEQFWNLLRDKVRPSHLVEGASFTFGKDRRGDIATLRQWSAKSEVKLHIVDAVEVTLPNLHIVQVNSTLVRWLVAHGRMRDAWTCLDRPYALRGEVIHGYGRGKQIGVATANLSIGEQVIPADGVYAGRCRIENVNYPAAISIGTMPTFEVGHRRQIEAHLIGLSIDLYGREIEVDILDWLREQWKFDSVASLKSRIEFDLKQVEQFTSREVTEFV